MKKYTFIFTCMDNGGKHQSFKIKASDMQEAIRKGFEKAKKNAAGDISWGEWDCRLDYASVM